MASKILIVDDDASSLNLLRMHLERDRFAVLTAGSGMEGLRLAYEHKPDAVILDVRMPGMDGHEVCGRLRDISDAAILFVTVLKAFQDIVRGLELGADDYIIKPFNYDELSARLQACLRRRAAQRRRAAAVGSQRNFRAHLAGRDEVLPVDTRAQGQAIVRISEDETSLAFKLIVANIQEVTQAHIHCGAAGENGPVVVFLYGLADPTSPNGVLSEGTITNADVIARPDSPECPGGVANFADLVAKIRSGDAYVNVHTVDNPGGEVRGQLR